MDLVWDSNKLGKIKDILFKDFSIDTSPNFRLRDNEIALMINHPKFFLDEYKNNKLSRARFSISPIVDNVCELEITYYGFKDTTMYIKMETKKLLSSSINIAKKYNLYDINSKLIVLKNIFEDIKKNPTKIVARILDSDISDDIVLWIDDSPHKVKITVPTYLKDEEIIIDFVGGYIIKYIYNSIKSFVTKVTPESILSHYIDYLKKSLNNK